MIKYGLISETDARTIEKTLDLVMSEFNDEFINVTEVGLYAGDTGFGITKYLISKNRGYILTGIENNKDGEEIRIRTVYDILIIGNSNEVYNKIEDNSQHMIFLDANHSFPSVVQDWFCYETKVKLGGYFLLHDTGEHIKPFKDYQGYGNKNDPDFYISVRKALHRIGVLSDELYGWRLIFDEADKNNEAGGICCFQKYTNIK